MLFCCSEFAVMLSFLVLFALAFFDYFYNTHIINYKVLSFVRSKYGEKNVEKYAYRLRSYRGG